MSDYWDEDQVRIREQDEVDGWPGLPQVAARVGVSPRTLQQLGDAGIVDVRNDRSGRPRVSLDEATWAAEHLSGRAERFEEAGFSLLEDDQ